MNQRLIKNGVWVQTIPATMEELTKTWATNRNHDESGDTFAASLYGPPLNCSRRKF